MTDAWDLLRREPIVHRRALQRAGWSNMGLKRALHSGQLERTRRDWFRVPGVEGNLERAAWVGARLSCISAAEHLGLWTIADGAFHVSALRSSSRLNCDPRPGDTGRALVHWARPIAPVTCERLIDPIENVLACVAECQGFESALVVFDSALNKRLITPNRLSLLATTLGGRFAELTASTDGKAESGLESLPRVRLARLGIRMRLQVMIAGHRVDGLVGERLVLQFDGDRWHSSPADRERDRRHDALLQLDGYTVLRYGTSAIMRDWATTEAEIVSAIAERLHLAPAPAPAPAPARVHEEAVFAG